VYCFCIFGNKLDLKQERSFYYNCFNWWEFRLGLVLRNNYLALSPLPLSSQYLSTYFIFFFISLHSAFLLSSFFPFFIFISLLFCLCAFFSLCVYLSKTVALSFNYLPYYLYLLSVSLSTNFHALFLSLFLSPFPLQSLYLCFLCQLDSPSSFILTLLFSFIPSLPSGPFLLFLFTSTLAFFLSFLKSLSVSY